MDELRDAARALDRVIIFELLAGPRSVRRQQPRVALGQVRHPEGRAQVLYDRHAERLAAVGGHRVVGEGRRHERGRQQVTGNAPMLSYILKRLLLMIPTILGVLTVTFVDHPVRAGRPGRARCWRRRAPARAATPATYQARRDIDAAQVAELKALYGFDKPPLERYLSMLKSFAQFDLGKSFFRNKDVWTLIKEKLPVSISLGLWTFLLSYLISIPLGVAKAVREGTRFDTLTTLLVLVGFAIPGFVLGVLLIVLFAGGSFLDWFPLRGLTSDNWDEPRLAGAHHRLPVAHGAAAHLLRDRQLRGRHDADQEHVRRGDPQAVRAGRARQGAVRAARAVQARVPQCADSDRHRLSGGVRRRVLRRLAADRDAVLARRPRAAGLRVDRAARLSGRARHALFLHADGPRGQADRRPAATWSSTRACSSGRSAK